MDKLEILIIGKYPPIEGGESAKLYWLAKGLGERGHNITIISNCQETEDEYKVELPVEELQKLQPRNVKLYSTHPFYETRLIPRYNPFSEKLTSLALEAIEKKRPDLILGWYLLPYAVAAFNVAKLTGIPYAIQHAGSDITRLLTHPYLNQFLTEVIKNADGILTYPNSKRLFESLGCKNIYVHRVEIPYEFNSTGSEFDLNKFNLNADRTILFLGKLSKSKGVDYLLDAFSMNNKNDALLLVGCGRNKQTYEERIRNNNIKNVYFANCQPPWAIPSIIRAVDAVVVPECDFGVKTHTSRIPLEAMCCGTPLVLSKYISRKYKAEFENCYLEIDPKNKYDFANSIDRIINDAALRDKLIINSKKVRQGSDFKAYLSSIEEIFNKIIFS